MKYRLTPINILCFFLLLTSAVSRDWQETNGFERIGLYYVLLFIAIGMILDLMIQLLIKKRKQLIIIQGILLVVIITIYGWHQRSKTLIIDHDRKYDFVAIIYGVHVAEPLPVNFFTWQYDLAINVDGIVHTSTPMSRDIRKTKFAASKTSSSNTKGNYEALYGAELSPSKLVIDGDTLNYRAWKISSMSSISYSLEDVSNLEESIRIKLSQAYKSSK